MPAAGLAKIEDLEECKKEILHTLDEEIERQRDRLKIEQDLDKIEFNWDPPRTCWSRSRDASALSRRQHARIEGPARQPRAHSPSPADRGGRLIQLPDNRMFMMNVTDGVSSFKLRYVVLRNELSYVACFQGDRFLPGVIMCC